MLLNILLLNYLESKSLLRILKLKKNQNISDVLSLIRTEASKALEGSKLEAKLTGKIPIDIARRNAMKTEKVRFQIIGYIL